MTINSANCVTYTITTYMLCCCEKVQQIQMSSISFQWLELLKCNQCALHLCICVLLDGFEKVVHLTKGPFALIIKSSLAIGNNILGICCCCVKTWMNCVTASFPMLSIPSKHFKCFDSFSFCIHKFIWLEFVQIFPGEIIQMISQ